MRLTAFVATLLAACLVTANAKAAVIFSYVLDPATTAGGGSTSTQSGAGRYHLYAYDNTAGSLGIAGYNINLTGVTSNLHRTPRIDYEDIDGNIGSGGFPVLRTANNARPMTGVQPLAPSLTQITGFGRESSSFAAKLPPDLTIFGPTTSATWGSNVTKPAGWDTLPWLFITEGQYSATPSIGPGSAVLLYDESMQFFDAEICVIGGTTCSIPPPLVVNDAFHNILAGNPAVLTHTFTQSGGDEPITWDQFSFLRFVPTFGSRFSNGLAAAANATFDPDSQLFSWETVGAPAGEYVWSVRASNAGGSDTGTLSIYVFVPEPASIALFAIAMVGALGLVRRRGN